MMSAMSRTRSKNGAPARLRRFARQGAAVTVLAGGLLLAAAFGAVAIQGNAVARDASGLRSDIGRLEDDLARKRAAVAERQTDAYVVEKARELGFVRPGEALIVVRRETERAIEQTVAAQPGRLAKWWSVFAR